MAQQEMLSENEITDIITALDTDDKLSSDEKNAKTPLGSLNSSSARTAFIAGDSSEDKSDVDSSSVTSSLLAHKTMLQPI